MQRGIANYHRHRRWLWNTAPGRCAPAGSDRITVLRVRKIPFSAFFPSVIPHQPRSTQYSSRAGRTLSYSPTRYLCFFPFPSGIDAFRLPSHPTSPLSLRSRACYPLLPSRNAGQGGGGRPEPCPGRGRRDGMDHNTHSTGRTFFSLLTARGSGLKTKIKKNFIVRSLYISRNNHNYSGIIYSDGIIVYEKILPFRPAAGFFSTAARISRITSPFNLANSASSKSSVTLLS